MRDWWTERHSDGKNSYLGDSAGIAVWKFFGLEDYIKSEAVILNVGVGTGRCTKDLKDKGVKELHVLDITDAAIEKVKDIAVGYTTPQDLPDNKFDLIISHLVVQHINDEELLFHLGHYLRSLKNAGFAALQFRDTLEDKGGQSFITQRSGRVCRSQLDMRNLIDKVGGKILKWLKTEEITVVDGALPVLWHGVYIIK